MVVFLGFMAEDNMTMSGWTLQCFLGFLPKLLSGSLILTFDIIFGIENDSTKYFKKSCWQCPNIHFSIKYFPNYSCLCHFIKCLLWLLWALMGLPTQQKKYSWWEVWCNALWQISFSKVILFLSPSTTCYS